MQQAAQLSTAIRSNTISLAATVADSPRRYLELRDGSKRYLTGKGKDAGGEFRFGKGAYFLWPGDLKV